MRHEPNILSWTPEVRHPKFHSTSCWTDPQPEHGLRWLKAGSHISIGLSQHCCVDSTINIICCFILIDPCVSEAFAKKFVS